MIGRPIVITIDGKTEHHESVPDAVASYRRYVIDGGRASCQVYQDYLIYTIDVSPDYKEGLP